MGPLVQFARGSAVSPAEMTGITATTTSKVCSARGHNALILYTKFVTGSGTWTVKIQGALTADGTYMDMYDSAGNLMAISSATASKAKLMVGIPSHFKIVATEDSNGATVDVGYELLTV